MRSRNLGLMVAVLVYAQPNRLNGSGKFGKLARIIVLVSLIELTVLSVENQLELDLNLFLHIHYSLLLTSVE